MIQKVDIAPSAWWWSNMIVIYQWGQCGYNQLEPEDQKECIIKMQLVKHLEIETIATTASDSGNEYYKRRCISL